MSLGNHVPKLCGMYLGLSCLPRCCGGSRGATKKKFHGEESYLPNREPVGAHTAEVLRQVEGAGVEKGGWVGGDAWFGSIMTAVEVKKRFGVHSTFIIKNNRTLFPMRGLKRVLEARYGEHPAGHWVVFTTEIYWESV